MNVRLAVRPKVIVNLEESAYWVTLKWALAARWLGDKYLCHQPINRKTEHA